MKYIFRMLLILSVLQLGGCKIAGQALVETLFNWHDSERSSRERGDSKQERRARAEEANVRRMERTNWPLYNESIEPYSRIGQ